MFFLSALIAFFYITDHFGHFVGNKPTKNIKSKKKTPIIKSSSM